MSAPASFPMVEHLVCLLEEESAAAFLRVMLPRVLPAQVQTHFLVFEGKQDLHKRMEGRLRGWIRPKTAFLVLRDQDSADCKKVKTELRLKCAAAGQSGALIRIACQELEAFFLGDLSAVGAAFDAPKLAASQGTAKFRDPDRLASPSHELAKLLNVRSYPKIDGARRIAQHMDLNKNTSKSFAALLTGLSRVTSV